MSMAVLILRATALLAFGGLGLIPASGRSGEKRSPSGERRGSRLPVLANFSGFGLFFTLLAAAPGGTEGPMAPATASGPSSCCGSSLASHRCSIGGSA